MSKTEIQSRTGGDLSPLAEVKTAVAGFVSEFNKFRLDIQRQLEQQEEKVSKMERKSLTKAARPVLARGADADAPHKKAFDAYLRSGDDDALRGLRPRAIRPRLTGSPFRCTN
jgi:hypothetical protein